MGHSSDPLAIYMLDVGQGECTFIAPPGADPVLMDCRDAHVAVRFVTDHGIERISDVVVSHLDIDHIQGLLPFLREFLQSGGAVARIWIGTDRPASELTGAGRALLDYVLELEDEGAVELRPAFREGGPRTIASGSDWSLELVLPRFAAKLKAEVSRANEPNQLSAVLRAARQGVAVVLGGDAPLSAWSGVEPGLLKARAIRAPHHGGGLNAVAGSLSLSDLYHVVGADTGILSVGTGNPHDHPEPMHVQALRRGGACRACARS